MSLLSFGALFLFLLLFVAGWFLFSYLLSPSMEEPDGYARITGNCGDTMEIGFKVDQGRVVETHHWTDGCSVSAQCVESAARLMLDKKPCELKTINMMHIMDEVGRLPESHLHCAQLAETTIQKAVENYIATAREKGYRGGTAA